MGERRKAAFAPTERFSAIRLTRNEAAVEPHHDRTANELPVIRPPRTLQRAVRAATADPQETFDVIR